MPDVAQMTSDLRGISDQSLQNELQHPTGLIPSYLVLAEAQRRQLMRQAAQKSQQGQSGSVLDDVVRNMMASQPPQGGPPAPVGMTPPRQQQQPMPGAMPPNQMGMARGGAVRMAGGGSADNKAFFQRYFPSPSYSDEDVDGWINKYSPQYGVDPDLARAVMKAESGRKGQAARSPKHAIGLFQLMPGTAQDMGIDPHDPEQNVQGGIRYLGDQLKKYKGQETLALAAYNAGPGNVDKFGGVPPFKETLGYVPTVLGIRDQLKKSRASQQPAEQPAEQTAQTTEATPTQDPFAEQTDLGWTQNAPDATPPPPAADTNTSTDTSADTSADTTPPAAAPPAAAPPSAGAAPAAALPASYVMPVAQQADPYSQANIDKTRNLYNTIFNSSPERQQQLDQERAATIAQLKGLREEAIQRYHNPSPWEFLSNIAAGMGSSHQLSLPLMFGEGVGRAWQARDQQQERALTDAEALQQRIDGITSAGESERQRMGASMVTMLGQQEAQLGKAPQGQQSFQKFVDLGAPYGEVDPNHPEKAPGPGMVGIPDPNRPGFGVWVKLNEPLKQPKAGKPEPREQQIFGGAVKATAQQYDLPEDTPYQNLPVSLTLKKPVKLQQALPQADGSVLAAGTVLPAGTTVYPQHEAELIADRSKAEQAQQTSAKRLTGTVDGRRQLANDPNFAPDWTDEQKQYYIQSGKKPENIDSLADAVANYQITLQQAMSRGALSDRNALIGRVMQRNPQYNMGEQEAQYKNFQSMEKAFGSGQQAQRMQTVSTLVHHMGVLDEAASAMQTGDFRTLNRIAKNLKMQLGATPQDTYRAIVHAVGPETTKAYISSGGTREDRSEVEKDFSEDLPPETLHANISARAKLLGGVINPLMQEYVNGTYGRGTRHLGFFTPEMVGELNKLAPTAVKSVTRAQLQEFANTHTNGNLAAAQKHFADAGILLAP